MDSAYDRENIYEQILFDYNAQVIIPINPRNSKQPPAGYYDYKGTPVCRAGHKMVYWVHYNGDNRMSVANRLCKWLCLVSKIQIMVVLLKQGLNRGSTLYLDSASRIEYLEEHL